MSKVEPTIGVIGGSGLYDIEGLTDVERVRLTTPFGDPSDEYVVGRLGGKRVAFLPRHGRGHRILPHEINFRANLHGMKQLGVESILSISAVGSLKDEIRPGDLVVVDQFIDRTKARAATFFGDGVAGHVTFADPVCESLAKVVATAAERAAASSADRPRVQRGGTYVVMEGPIFSTRAESHLYRSWGADVIGMTNLPEAKLAREAEICYSTIALATDYDCWHESEADVTVEAILAVIAKNVALARAAIKGVIETLPAERSCACKSAAQFAIVTSPETIPPAARIRLEALYGKYWGRA